MIRITKKVLPNINYVRDLWGNKINKKMIYFEHTHKGTSQYISRNLKDVILHNYSKSGTAIAPWCETKIIWCYASQRKPGGVIHVDNFCIFKIRSIQTPTYEKLTLESTENENFIIELFVTKK